MLFSPNDVIKNVNDENDSLKFVENKNEIKNINEEKKMSNIETGHAREKLPMDEINE